MICATFGFLLAATVPNTASIALLRAAVNPNPMLRSYVASASLVAHVRAGISLGQSFTGTAYYDRPKERLVFDNVPAPLRRFQTLDATLPSSAEANADYDIIVLENDGRLATYELDPKNAATRVRKLVLEVDAETALITTAIWTYRNGGSLRFTQTYETIGAYRLPSTITISARFPAYAVNGVVHLTDYRLDVGVPPSVFASAHP